MQPETKSNETTDTTSGSSQSKEDKLSSLENDPLTTGVLALAKEEGIKTVLLVGDLVLGWVKKFYQAGIKVIFRPATPYPKIVGQATDAGVDAIITTGFEEGGTVPAKVVGTFVTVPMVVGAAKGVPVIATGGITDKRTVKAAFDLGAEGIYAGTAFLAAKESRLAENIKEKMINTGAEDMVMFRAPNSFYRFYAW